MNFKILFFLVFFIIPSSASTLHITNNTSANLDNGAFLTLVYPQNFTNTSDPIGRTYNASSDPKSTLELNFNTTRVRWHSATNHNLSLITYDSTNDILRFNVSGSSGYLNTTLKTKNASEIYNFKVNDTVVYTNTSDGNGVVSFNYTGGNYKVTIYAGLVVITTTNVSGFVNNTLGAPVDGVRVDLDHNYTFTEHKMVPNNTNLATTVPGEIPGTGERLAGGAYQNNGSDIQLLVYAHAMNSGDNAEIHVFIDGVKVQDQSGKPLGVAESNNKSVALTIPKGHNYSLEFNNVHHYVWYEYPVFEGYYEFHNIPTGTYNLTFQQVAYKNNSQSVTLTASNYTINATMIPQFTPEEADFVITTADLTYLAFLLAILDLALLMRYKRKKEGKNKR